MGKFTDFLGKVFPFVGSGLSLFQGMSERKAVREANQSNIDNQWEMYNRQRTDMIADRQFENEYNSPANVMKRYQEGGLNPNLVTGTVGANASVHTGVPSGSQAHREPVPAGAGFGALNAYFDTRVKEQQLDNLKQVQKNLITHNNLEGSKTAGQDYDNIMKQLLLYPEGNPNNNSMEDMYSHGLYGQKAQESLRQLQNQIGFQIDENKRRDLLNNARVGEITQRISLMVKQGLNLDQVRENLKKDGTLKDLEIQFHNMGMSSASVGQWIGYVLQSMLRR